MLSLSTAIGSSRMLGTSFLPLLTGRVGSVTGSFLASRTAISAALSARRLIGL